MKNHPRKIVLFMVIIVAAVALVQSGQHCQITDFVSNLFGSDEAPQ